MITKVFSVYDSKAKSYGVPFFCPVTAVAARMFTDLVNDKSTTVSKHPEDFSLFEVGSYDDEKGELMPIGKPVNLGLASVFVKGHGPKEVYIPAPVKA